MDVCPLEPDADVARTREQIGWLLHGLRRLTSLNSLFSGFHLLSLHSSRTHTY